MNRPLAIVGDVHGDATRLAALIADLVDRHLIFLGDYVNRGAESKQTLDILLALRERDPQTIFLLGNHDAALLAYLDGTMSFYEFAGLGGIATIRAYLGHIDSDVRAEFADAFPESHRSFLKSCGDYLETAEAIVSHCGINPNNPESRQKTDMVMSRHEGLFLPEFAYSKLVVCGHYVQRAGVPYVHDGIVCLDTGCGTTNGPLTALLMPERAFVQR